MVWAISPFSFPLSPLPFSCVSCVSWFPLLLLPPSSFILQHNPLRAVELYELFDRQHADDGRALLPARLLPQSAAEHALAQSAGADHDAFVAEDQHPIVGG